MADIYGVVIGGTSSAPQNGVTVTLWSQAVVATLPALNTSPPSSGSTATTTTGSAHGADGAFQFTGVGAGTYFLSWVLSSNTYWSEYQVPTLGSALATFNTAGGLTLGSASDLMSGAAGLYTAGALTAAVTTLTGALTGTSATLTGSGTALTVTHGATAASLSLSGAGTALTVTNNATIGQLTLGGATGLTVTNASTFNGQATFAGTGYGLVVNNNLQVLGTLAVATLTPTTFTVSGATTFNGSVSATAAGTSLAVTNNQTIGGTLLVSASGTALTVTNAASIANLTLTGASNGLVVNNNALVSGNLIITGSLTAGSYSPVTLSTSGALSSGSTLGVTGLSTLTGGFSSLAVSTVSIASGTPLTVTNTADTVASTSALAVSENAGHSSLATLVSALSATAANRGTGGSTALAGARAGLLPISGSAATGPITLASALWAASPTTLGRTSNSVTVSTMAGVHIDDQNPSLAGVTNTATHALDIAVQTGATSYALYNAGGGIYSKTNDAAQVGMVLDTVVSPSADILDISINGTRTAYFNSAAALTLGATGTGLTVTNNALVSGNLAVTGALSTGSYSPLVLSVTNNLSAGGTLTITGGAAFNGTPNGATQQVYIKSNAIGVIPLVVDAISGQTGNLQNWNVNGSGLALMTAAGVFQSVGLSTNATLPGSTTNYLKARGDSSKALVVDTTATPSVDAFDVNINGTNKFKIDNSGNGSFAGNLTVSGTLAAPFPGATTYQAVLSADTNLSGGTNIAVLSLTLSVAGTYLVMGTMTVGNNGSFGCNCTIYLANPSLAQFGGATEMQLPPYGTWSSGYPFLAGTVFGFVTVAAGQTVYLYGNCTSSLYPTVKATDTVAGVKVTCLTAIRIN